MHYEAPDVLASFDADDLLSDARGHVVCVVSPCDEVTNL
jgi:hypothetical protein